MPQVLIVDDDADIRSSLKDILELTLDGVAVRTAPSGHDALALLAERPVDLVITDYRMPGMNGLEFIERVHTLAPGVPTLLISAEGGIRRENTQSRRDLFLPKPMDVDEFIETSRQLLSSHGGARGVALG